jgi:ribose transport system substrate-binding protein
MIGFDANPEAHEAILDPENGKIWIADVAQDPYKIGYTIAEQMVQYCTKGTVDETTILIEPYLVDASNASLDGSSKPAPSGKLDGAGMKLGFILGSREHAFYCSIEDGILDAAADLGFEAVVLESDLDGAIASERIETLVVDGCDAISLSVNDPSGCTPAIEAADAEGVPMFAFDCTSTETDVIKCFVGTDNYQGGVVGGEATIKYLEDNGLTNGATIGIIGYPEPQSCIDREQGWYSVVNQYKDKYKLNIVNIGNYKGDASTAESLMSDALTQYPDMAVIFTVGDPACVGALAAIKAAGASTTMIGFDANPEAHEAILDPENGKIWIADVAQDPYKIGYTISEQMLTYLKNGNVGEKTILISPYLVDASNASVN